MRLGLFTPRLPYFWFSAMLSSPMPVLANLTELSLLVLLLTVEAVVVPVLPVAVVFAALLPLAVVDEAVFVAA